MHTHECVNTLRGGKTCGNGLLPSFVSPSVRTSSTLGTSGLSPVSIQPKKSWPASSKALSVLVPPRIWGNAFMAFFREFAFCVSVNLKTNTLRLSFGKMFQHLKWIKLEAWKSGVPSLGFSKLVLAICNNIKHSTSTESEFQVSTFRLTALLKMEKILWTRLQSLTSFNVLF